MKRLIINGDDLGLTEGVNRGIIEAYRNGALTSSTIMVNMLAFDDAVKLVAANSGLGVGVHLNILGGRSVSNPEELSEITDTKGAFFEKPCALLKKAANNQKALLQIEKEFRLQIQKAMEAGINVTHLDSHKHIHCYPKIMNIVIRLAREFKVNRVRYVNEKVILDSRIILRRLPGLFILNLFSKSNLSKFSASGILHNDHFFGFLYTGLANLSVYKRMLGAVEDGITEIMVHPGFCTEELKNISSLATSREDELKIITGREIKEIIRDRGIQLINYGNLN